jgi:hypothetical protein
MRLRTRGSSFSAGRSATESRSSHRPADTEADIHARFAGDPWTPMELLRIAKIEPWQILLGEAAT